MQTEPEQWAVDAWERYGPMIFNCEITGPEALQLVVEERERKLREAVIGMRKHADIFDGGKHQANRLAFDEFARAALGEKP